MKEKILITLATGRTGFATAAELLRDGYPVRILVRSKNKKAVELEKLGAEVAIGEFNNYEQLKKALTGVQRAYYCYPIMKKNARKRRAFYQSRERNRSRSCCFYGTVVG